MRGTGPAIIVSNATAWDISVKFDDMDAVRRTNAREKGFGVGADIGGAANLEVNILSPLYLI